jgi:phosphopantothenoylcysteine decarboxylase / phosphopantothenate---cysteine ligase
MNVLISMGPTRAFLDPVRFISNISSGKMGLELIKQALKLKSKVRVVSGPVNINFPKNIKVINVETNEEMYKALLKNFKWADVFISNAAVLDFVPKKISKNKIKKTSEPLVLKFYHSMDILKKLSCKKNKKQIVVGFALETENLKSNGLKKLKEKKLDLIAVNSSASLGSTFSCAMLINKNGACKKLGLISKRKFAREIYREINSKFKMTAKLSSQIM